MLDNVRNVLAILGVLFVLPLSYRLLSFIFIYFIRPSSINNYLTGPAPYALITGASDGIGKGVAKELYRRGFNLILHGRNEEKTRNVVAEIKASGGDGDIRYFLADATAPGHDFTKIVAEFKNLNITFVMNNVGGSKHKVSCIDGWTNDELLDTIRWNALFALGLTRALLPQLRASLRPVLVMSVGSFAADVPPPRLVVYAAAKRFMQSLSEALETDERYWAPSNIRFMYICPGSVSTNAFRMPVSFVCPDATTFAKAVVDRVGCNRRSITPYVGHTMSQWALQVFGEEIAEKIISATITGFLFKDGKKPE